MIRIKDLNSDLLKIEKKSYKNIDIYYIGYITMKDTDYVNIHSVNPLYFIIHKAYGYIKKINRNKYLTLVSNNKNKEVLTKHTELWDKIKDLIKTINSKPDEYEKGFIKINFDSDVDLPLGKILSLHNMRIVVRFVY